MSKTSKTILIAAIASITAISPASGTMGTLAKVNAACNVLVAPKANAAVYSHLASSQYLVVVKTGEKWSQILLQNGKVGYVPSADVKTLGFEITASNRNLGLRKSQ